MERRATLELNTLKMPSKQIIRNVDEINIHFHTPKPLALSP
ncbi:hypothetical protein B0G71_7946 [Paraburkholderia sp. BL27I4N3]|nr:hypothetical protein B0G71_7946 [Paraburkholderia sp. BL27I4N3]